MTKPKRCSNELRPFASVGRSELSRPDRKPTRHCLQRALIIRGELQIYGLTPAVVLNAGSFQTDRRHEAIHLQRFDGLVAADVCGIGGALGAKLLGLRGVALDPGRFDFNRRHDARDAQLRVDAHSNHGVACSLCSLRTRGREMDGEPLPITLAWFCFWSDCLRASFREPGVFFNPLLSASRSDRSASARACLRALLSPEESAGPLCLVRIRPSRHARSMPGVRNRAGQTRGMNHGARHIFNTIAVMSAR
jgi:hypothetical protein